MSVHTSEQSARRLESKKTRRPSDDHRSQASIGWMRSTGARGMESVSFWLPTRRSWPRRTVFSAGCRNALSILDRALEA